MLIRFLLIFFWVIHSKSNSLRTFCISICISLLLNCNFLNVWNVFVFIEWNVFLWLAPDLYCIKVWTLVSKNLVSQSVFFYFYIVFCSRFIIEWNVFLWLVLQICIVAKNRNLTLRTPASYISTQWNWNPTLNAVPAQFSRMMMLSLFFWRTRNDVCVCVFDFDDRSELCDGFWRQGSFALLRCSL